MKCYETSLTIDDKIIESVEKYAGITMEDMEMTAVYLLQASESLFNVCNWTEEKENRWNNLLNEFGYYDNKNSFGGRCIQSDNMPTFQYCNKIEKTMILHFLEGYKYGLRNTNNNRKTTWMSIATGEIFFSLNDAIADFEKEFPNEDKNDGRTFFTHYEEVEL